MICIVRKHWFLVFPRLLQVAIIISLLIIFANKFGGLAKNYAIIAILIACLAVYFTYAWILLRINYYIITDDRIIRVKQEGIWDRGLNEISVPDIASVKMEEKGIAAAFFKFGSIKIVLKNEEIFNISNIAEPVKIYQGLIKLKGIKKA